MALLEKNATKLNADKTGFDPGPVGVLLTFRFRNCSRPLPVRYERTPSVSGCQYPFPEFLQTAPRCHVISFSFSLSTLDRSALLSVLSSSRLLAAASIIRPFGQTKGRVYSVRRSPAEEEAAMEMKKRAGRAGSAPRRKSVIVGAGAGLVGRRQSPLSGVISGLSGYGASHGGARRRVRAKLNADSLDLRPNHRRSAGFPLQGLLPSASGLR